MISLSLPYVAGVVLQETGLTAFGFLRPLETLFEIEIAVCSLGVSCCVVHDGAGGLRRVSTARETQAGATCDSGSRLARWRQRSESDAVLVALTGPEVIL